LTPERDGGKVTALSTADTFMKSKPILLVVVTTLILARAVSATTVHDLSREFSVVSNPNSPWTYGASLTLGGTFIVMTDSFTSAAGNGVPFVGWRLQPATVPSIQGYPSDLVATDADGGVYPPGTIILNSGDARFPARYGVTRFTVPNDGAGTYRIETTGRSYLDNPPAGDTDYHVLHNGVELFGVFLPPTVPTAYTNEVELAAGDQIDFVVGPGMDASASGSGLKLMARLTTSCQPVTNTIVMTNIIVFTNTVVVTNTPFITNSTSLAILRDTLESSTLPARVTRPLERKINQARRALERLDSRAQSRVAPKDAALAEEIQALVHLLLGLEAE
jgi:hypothetical protein